MLIALLLFVMTSAIVFLALFNGTLYFTDAFQEITDVTKMMIKNHSENQSLSSKVTEQQSPTEEEEKTTINSTSLLLPLRLLTNILETRINGTAALLELTSKLPEVRNTQYVSSISEEFIGIPQNLDSEKRKIAQYILEQNKDIVSIFFLTPTGDIYIGEPFSDQKQLPRLNFADRDWYRGVTRTNDTYTSAVFVSAATHAPATAIAVPVYGNSMGNNVSTNVNYTTPPVVGYWVGIINPAKIKEDLSALDLLGHDDEVILVDQNGTQVVNILARTMNESSPLSFDNQSLKSYSQLHSVKNALNGKSGAAIEMINNIRKTVYYYPVQLHPYKWALLLLQPSHTGS